MREIALPSLCRAVVPVLLVAAVCLAGCTGTSPQGTPLPTTPATVATPLPTTMASPGPTPDPFPDALSPGTNVPFTGGTGQGTATVYRYLVKSGYTWASPSWNSPREQTTTDVLGVGFGYNTATPREGNVFLFVFLRVASIGSGAVYAPSPAQFTVSFNGTSYPYSSVQGPDVTIDTVTGTQYDYLLGYGGTGGYVQPGESNQADGFLIFEVPAGFVPERTYVIGNLDPKTRAVWRLG
ncbi:MAG TPA: hypothetical protein P5217_03535 [Methanoregulaceae archaeon]|nr:hypothetical protein [Methanoregulaceae archaeon]HPD75788.1 hypothetical protein [Methanoregulaceae archaeon]HRY75333.1 hypothetical protein [Methanoregulaceae archaeon]